jgi:hypothetical protein
MVSDGWTIAFSRFEVTLREVSIAGANLEDPGPLDLVAPSSGQGQLVGRARVPAGDHADASFTIAELHIEGSANKDGTSKSFSWMFTEPVIYSECETTTSVPEGGVGEFQITVHADHLFYDSLVSEEPTVRFDPIAAADTDEDGVVTATELSATDIGAYDPGNLDIDDLWSFLTAQTATMGHVDGEGHCVASS